MPARRIWQLPEKEGRIRLSRTRFEVVPRTPQPEAQYPVIRNS